jgi:large subunit ribosomal protein L19
MFILLILLNLIINLVERKFLNLSIPNIKIGDTIRLGLRIKEGDKERIQYYEGVIIAKKNVGLNKTITVRKVLQGIGIERIFLINSPRIISLEIKKSAKVNRSKLYYLRNLVGKATRLKQKY